MADDFEYISRARLEYRDGFRHAYLGEVAEPVVYGMQGGLRAYYGCGIASSPLRRYWRVDRDVLAP